MFDSDARAAVGQTLGDKYVVRRLLGSGGMGAVYEVEHKFTRRVGALKLLHQTYAGMPQVVERFIREASAAGRIGNPHIVETIDAGKFDTGEPYMFMELLAGSPVNDLIARRGRLQLEEATEIVAQAAEGLEAAHQKGIVHRDIKPENLFLCSGEKPFIKLLDFGISKFVTGDTYRLTADGAALGTPYYMSPEQVLGSADVDVRTDIYSLGVVLYECLTGRVPFEADALPALSVKIHSGDYPPLNTLLKDVPADIERVVTTAMARDPRQRYPSAEAFRKALLECRTSPAFSLAPTVFESAPAPPPRVTGTPAVTARPPAGSTTAGVASDTADAGVPASTRASEKTPTGGARTRWMAAGALVVGVGVGFAALNVPASRSQTVPSADHLPAPAEPAAQPMAPAVPDQPVAAPSASASLEIAASASASSEPEPAAPRPHEEVVSKPAAGASEPRNPVDGKSPAKAKSADTKPSRAAQDGLSEENPFSK